MTGPGEQQQSTENPAHEFKLGPVVFVPELAVRDRDPWAHRKGEPRVFALLWSMYLMAASLVTLFAAGPRHSPSTHQFEFGSRSLLLLLVIGATLLWPAIRLSQAAPRRVGRAVLVDLAIVLIPMQAMIWPMPLLTRWPLDVICGVVVLIGGWTLLSASLTYSGLKAGTTLARATSTCGCLAAVLTAPAAMALTSSLGREPLGQAWHLASPITAIWALTTAPSGLTPRMSDREWLFVSLPIVIAGICWVWGSRTPAASAPRSNG